MFFFGCGSAKKGETATSSETSEKASQESEETSGQVIQDSFFSKSLGVEKSYFTYLPVNYALSQVRYPVVYMLHGLGGQENNWTKYMQLAEAADSMQLAAIVVMPDGDDSFYVNSATEANYQECMQGSAGTDGKDLSHYCVKSASYENYIVDDLVSEVDGKFRTIASRDARGIGGLSMGGYGALTLAMRHLDVFSSSASHSGVAALLYQGPIPYQAGQAQLADDPVAFTRGLGRIGLLLLARFGPELERWRAHDPAFLVGTLPKGRLAIYIDCGTEDEFRLQHGASYLHELLESRGITHSFQLLPGGHDFSFWADRIDDSLAFHMRHLQQAESLSQ